MEEKSKNVPLSNSLFSQIIDDDKIIPTIFVTINPQNIESQSNITEKLNQDQEQNKNKDTENLKLSISISTSDPVYDISICNSIKKIIDGKWNVYETGTALNDLRQFIMVNYYPETEFESSESFTIGKNAIKVLDNIELQCVEVCGKYTLSDLLAKVWNFCLFGTKSENKSENESKGFKETKKIVVKELSECIENGEIICMKGKVMHILNSVSGIFQGLRIMTKKDFNAEIMTRAGKIAKTVYDGLSKRAKDIVDGNVKIITEDDQSISDYYDLSVKKKIRKTLKEEYVIRDKLLTKEQLYEIIGEWINKI